MNDFTIRDIAEVKRFDLNRKEHVEKLSKRIEASFKQLSGSSHGSEDCVQTILLWYVEGRGQKQTVDQIVIDYLRTFSGRKGLPGFAKRKSLEHAIAHGSAENADVDRGDSRGESFAGMDSRRMLKFIGNQVDRGCFVMFHQWGLSEVEIANIFGFSESRVSQRIKRVQSCLSARITAQKSRTSPQKMARLLCPEAERKLWGVGEVTFERMEIGESFGVASFNEKSF